jgi:hypothetical protein
MTDISPQMQDQTRFNDEGVYFESTPTQVPANQPPFLQTKRGKLVLVLSAVFGFLLITIGLVSLFGDGVDEEELPGLDDPIRVNRELTETEKKVQLLKDLLKSADPTKEQDPFPAVDLTFRLDAQER